jgi:hypothetical protein
VVDTIKNVDLLESRINLQERAEQSTAKDHCSPQAFSFLAANAENKKEEQS